MRMRGFVVAAVGFAALLVSAAAWGQPLADKVPGDAIVYVGWQGSESMPAGYAGSHLKGVLDASGFGQLVDDFLPRLMQRLGQENRDAAEISRLASAIGGPLWRHPSALYVGPVDITNPRQPVPSIALYCNAGNEAPALLRELQQIAAMAGRGPVPVNVSSEGNVVTVVLGKGTEAGAAALAASATFRQAMAQVQKDPVLAVYVDAEAALKLVDQAVEQGNDVGAKRDWPKLRDVLGLEGLKQLMVTGGFDGKEWSTQAFLAAPAPRTGLLTLMENPPLKDDILRAIPQTATMAGAGQLDLSRLLAEVRTALGKIDPRAQQQFDQGLADIRQGLGLDIQKDFLATFGPAWACYLDPGIGGTNMLGVVIVNRLNDPAQAERSLLQLEGLANAILQGQLQRQRMTLRFEQVRDGEVTVHYLGSPIVTPAWAIKDGNLYGGLYPQVVASAARHVSAKGKSILDNEQFTALRNRLGGEKATSVSFADLPKTAPQAYGTWLLISRLSGFGDLFGVKSPAMVLPPLPKLMEHLAPAGAASWTDQAGWHAKSLSPFPGSQAVATDPGSQVQQQAMLISILLPALNKARENANRVKCASNERQIGQAILLYANENNGKCPDDLGTLVLTQEIGAEVFVCPSGGRKMPTGLTPQQAARWVNENSDYIYVGKGKTVMQLGPEDVVVYDRLGTHASDGVNILFGDGHVTWQTMSSAMELIEKAGGGK